MKDFFPLFPEETCIFLIKKKKRKVREKCKRHENFKSLSALVCRHTQRTLGAQEDKRE
jgi:hypothetical protein